MGFNVVQVAESYTIPALVEAIVDTFTKSS
jgi:hypothetical protein